MLAIDCEKFSKRSRVGKSNVNKPTKKNDDMNLNYQQDHQRAWALLPWYTNGTLDTLELNAIDQHLSSCLVCRRELLALSALSDAVNQRQEDVECEHALARSHDRFDRHTKVAPMHLAVAASPALLRGIALLRTYKDKDDFCTVGGGYHPSGVP